MTPSPSLGKEIENQNRERQVQCGENRKRDDAPEEGEKTEKSKGRGGRRRKNHRGAKQNYQPKIKTSARQKMSACLGYGSSAPLAKTKTNTEHTHGKANSCGSTPYIVLSCGSLRASHPQCGRADKKAWPRRAGSKIWPCVAVPLERRDTHPIKIPAHSEHGRGVSNRETKQERSPRCTHAELENHASCERQHARAIGARIIYK